MNKDIKRIIVIEVVSNIVTSDRTIINFIVINVFFISGAISDDIVHVLSPAMRCDAMSKVFSTAPFKRGRDRLLNIQQKSTL